MFRRAEPCRHGHRCRWSGTGQPGRLGRPAGLRLWLASGLVVGALLYAGTAPARAAPSTVPSPSPASWTSGWQQLAALQFPVGERLPFEEITTSRILKRPLTASGELWLDADGSLIMAIDEPRFERRALEQHQVTLTRLRTGADRSPDNPDDLLVRRLPIQSDRPAQMLLRAIAQLLGGDIAALRANFELLADSAQPVSVDADSWELHLQPKAEPLRRQLPVVALRGAGDRLLAVQADRGRQGSQIVRLLQRAAQP